VAKPSFIGKLCYYCFPFRRNIVRENIEIVFGPSLKPRQKRALAQNFYAHVVKLFAENLSVIWMKKKEVQNLVQLKGHEHVFKAAEQKRGILILTGHLGNWELAPVAAMHHFPEFRGRFHILRRTIVNKMAERVFFGRYAVAGLDIVPKKHSLDQVLAFLANNDVVVFVMDQYANPAKDGILVDFFGKKAGTFRSLALIARATGAPVVPACCFRDTDGKHVMRFFPALPWIRHEDVGAEIHENTLAYNKALEQMILDHPDQWIWLHRRWKEKKAQ
jgi:KDO2-lipid IV(A) lauroyltransferase